MIGWAGTMIVSTEEADVTVELSVMIGGFNVAFKPAGDEDADRLIGPLKPFIVETSRDEIPLVPALSWRNEGAEPIVKKVPVT